MESEKHNKVLITGGSGGIAQAIKTLLEENDYIVLAPTRQEMDVTSWSSIDAVMKDFVPDILINNAGYVVPQSVRQMDLENTKKHFDINVGGTFYCTGIALKYNPDLEIVNICSAASIESHATWSEYCASKAAIAMATRCWAEDGLYAVAISPGRTRTKMRKFLFPDEDQSTLLEPIDFAKVVLKAVLKEYPSGENVIVRKQNVEQLLSE